MNKQNIADKNKDIVFSKLIHISDLPENSNWKASNYKELSQKYKTSLKQLQKGNKNFLEKFNTLYSNARYLDLSEYIDTFEKKPKKIIQNKKPKKKIVKK